MVPFKKYSVKVLGQLEFATFPEALQILEVSTPSVFSNFLFGSPE